MHKEAAAQAANAAGETAGRQKAEIIRSDIMFGNIRIRCPNDFTEHEISADLKEFLCPVDGTLLLL